MFYSTKRIKAFGTNRTKSQSPKKGVISAKILLYLTLKHKSTTKAISITNAKDTTRIDIVWCWVGFDGGICRVLIHTSYSEISNNCKQNAKNSLFVVVRVFNVFIKVLVEANSIDEAEKLIDKEIKSFHYQIMNVYEQL